MTIKERCMMAEKKTARPAGKKTEGESSEAGESPLGAQIHVDLGMGGLFKGISNLLDLVGNLAEAGESINRSGEVKFGDNEKMQGVYGFSIRTGLGGMPKVESFGNIRESEAGPVVADTREPIVDVFDEGDKLLVVAELPGVAKKEIKVELNGDVLALSTTGSRKYAKEVLLPASAKEEAMAVTYNNGVLEVRLHKAE
jgi:HSP20 family protein